MKRVALFIALCIASTAASAAAPAAMKEKVYSASKDTTFHAALAALKDVGASVQQSDFNGGTISAQTVSTKLMFTKATNWNVTVEEAGKDSIRVHLDRQGMNTFKSGPSDDPDPQPYAEF